MRRLLVVALVAAPGLARATGFTDIGQDFRPSVDLRVTASGALRLRGEALYNLDLDRGPLASGAPLFPVPIADPSSQTLTHADLRLRSDLAVYAPGGALAIKLRVDVLDNLAMGSLPEGLPAGTTSQRPPEAALRIKRAYGEALTPLGLLAAGRMGAHFGLGILANGGDCADCDSGDAADRVAFLTPLAGHIWALAYDLSATGPLTRRPSDVRPVDLDPTDDVRTVSFAVLRFRDELARARRRQAGKVTLDYGLALSHRWQDRDVPASYLPLASPVAPGPAQIMHRGYRATAADAWLRLDHPWVRVEAELAALFATVDEPSLIPGVRLRTPAESRQLGAAFESEVGPPLGWLAGGLDAGYASGDPAPGFGAHPRLGTAPGVAGDVDGAQADPPRDVRVDNFRFHPDYRIDRILFRELVGAVTDAFYLRPHVRATVFRVAPGTLEAQLAGIASWAVEPASTPGGEAALGFELDPSLVYRSRDGFLLAVEHAVLFPFGGLGNPEAKLPARPAQLVRVRMMYVF